jgi:hypothetical protein
MEQGPKFENNHESKIDLTSVEAKFCHDSEIEDYFDRKSEELNDPIEYARRNTQGFDRLKKYLESKGKNFSEEELVEIFIDDERYRFQRNKANIEKVLETKHLIEQNFRLILDLSRRRLSEYLPDWKPNSVTIEFNMMENADFMHPEPGKIVVDIWRLGFKKDPIEDVAEGISHELFHEWMCQEGVRQKNRVNIEEVESIEDLRRIARFKIVDEGLAILSSGYTLSDHYVKQKKDYDVRKSFELYNQFFGVDSLQEAKEYYLKQYENMGAFYVVGYEIAKSVLGKIGILEFRKIINNIRENPELLIDEYKKLCAENESFPRL